MNTVKISMNTEPMIMPYIAGQTYPEKGLYLGVSKGAHKFQRHNKPHFHKQMFGLGCKYHFEKI